MRSDYAMPAKIQYVVQPLVIPFFLCYNDRILKRKEAGQNEVDEGND